MERVTRASSSAAKGGTGVEAHAAGGGPSCGTDGAPIAPSLGTPDEVGGGRSGGASAAANEDAGGSLFPLGTGAGRFPSTTRALRRRGGGGGIQGIAAAAAPLQPPRGEPPLPTLHTSVDVAESAAKVALAAFRAAVSMSTAADESLRAHLEKEEASTTTGRATRSGLVEGRIDPLFGNECAALIRMTSKPFAELPRVLQRRVVEAARRVLQEAADAADADWREKCKEAFKLKAAFASEHNAMQSFVLLPDVLQNKIIDLLPAGR